MTVIFKNTMRGLVWSFLFVTIPYQLQAQLSQGEVMFTGFSADGNGGFSMINLVELPSATYYFSTDNWSVGGGSFDTSGGDLTWTTGGTIAVGTKIIFTDISVGTPTVTNGSLSATNMPISATDEVIYFFRGSDADTPDRFVTAIAQNGYSGANGELPTDLTIDTDAVEITGEGNPSDMLYNGSTSCNSTVADCAALLADDTNWEFSPTLDFPTDVPDFGGTILPIELASFDAQVTESRTVLISWQTSVEINNEYFAIERSRDGSLWDVIAEMRGAGNSTTNLSYAVLDEAPLAGLSYYRLKQTDFDGQFSYSWVRSVEVSGVGSWKVFPSRATDWVNVQGILPSELAIYSPQGRDVSGSVRIQSEGVRFRLGIEGLSSGLYIIKSPQGAKRIIRD